MEDGPSRSAPLILVPGMLCDARVFGPLLARLPGRRSIVPTLDGASISELAARILAEAPRAFALLGFSLGGVVALEIAAQAPDRVLGLALVGSNARGVADADRAARRAEAASAAAAFHEHLAERLWPSYVAAPRRGDAALRRAITAMAKDGGPAALLAQTELGLTRAVGLGRLAGLAMPALVLAGDADARCPPAMQREMAERLPNAVLALMPGAGHFVLMEAPDAAAAHVAAWLSRVDDAAALVNQSMLQPVQEIP